MMEPMEPMRRANPTRRAWLPALVAAVALAVLLWLLQALAEVGWVAERVEATRTYTSTSFIDSFVFDDLTYFGPDAFDLITASGRYAAGAVVGTLAVLGLSFVTTWLAVRGSRPRAVVTVFLATWAATILACGIGAWLIMLVRLGGRAFEEFNVAHQGHLVDFGAMSGVSWGWGPALLAAITWLLVSPRDAQQVYHPPPREMVRPAGE
jgi:hypothetical protein